LSIVGRCFLEPRLNMSDIDATLVTLRDVVQAPRTNIWVMWLIWFALFASLGWSAFLVWLVGLILGIF
jgi:hypothetical protein